MHISVDGMYVCSLFVFFSCLGLSCACRVFVKEIVVLMKMHHLPSNTKKNLIVRLENFTLGYQDPNFAGRRKKKVISLIYDFGLHFF